MSKRANTWAKWRLAPLAMHSPAWRPSPAHRSSAPASPVIRSNRKMGRAPAHRWLACSAGASPRCRATTFRPRSRNSTSSGRPRRYPSCSSWVQRPIRQAAKCPNRKSAPRISANSSVFSKRRPRINANRVARAPHRRNGAARSAPFALLQFALLQIVIGGAHGFARRRTVGIKVFFGNDGHAAVLAHLEDIETPRRARIHPMLALELGGHALDCTLDAKRLAATDAGKWRLFLESAGCRGGGAEVDLRFERDHLFRTGCLAQAALHAGVLGKAQQRPLRIIPQRSRRTGGDAGEAERAALNIELHGAERRRRRQGQHVEGRRRDGVQFAQRLAQDAAFAPDGQEARHRAHRADGNAGERRIQGFWIVRLDHRHAAGGKPQPNENGLSKLDGLVETRHAMGGPRAHEETDG